MKKLLKILMAFTLVFVLSFNCVRAQETDPEEVEVILEISSKPVVTIKGDNNSLKLSWDSVENAKAYKIERSTNSKKGFKKIATVSDITYKDKGLAYGTTYYYKVTAINDISKKTSDVVSKKVSPNKVANVVLKQSGSTKIKISWDKVKTTGYYIFRSTDGKKWTKIKNITKNATLNFTDSKLKSNKVYCYRVQAYKTVGKKTYTGSKSTIVSIRTAPAAPSVKFYSEDLDTIRLNIKKVSGANLYKLYEYNEKSKKWELLWNIYPEWFNDGVYNDYIYAEKPYHTYKFKVKACKNDVCGSYKEVSGKAVLSKPKIDSLRGENKAVNISIANAYDSDGIEIYRATSKNGKYSKIKTLKNDVYEFKDKNVSKNKTYYYKVRSFVKISKKTYYSSYSKVRVVKTGSNAGINSAIEDAKVLNKEWYFSKNGLINTLVEFYGYSKSDAKKGVEKCSFDYKANALKLAKSYVSDGYAMSENGLKNILMEEHLFTESEAKYAISKIKFDWHQSLVNEITNNLMYGGGYGRDYYIRTYTSSYSGFTEEEVNSVIDELNIDFEEESIKRINQYLSWNSPSRTEIYNYMEEYGFTEDEIEYAISNVEINWIEAVISAYNDYEYYDGNHNYYSRAKAVNYLTSDECGFTEEEVEEALNSLEIDFNEYALEYAKNELSRSDYSPEVIRQILTSELFTEEEIEYAINNINFDEIAYNLTLNVINSMGRGDRPQISAYLKSGGFTEENITYVLNKITNDEWVVLCRKTIDYYVSDYNTRVNMGLSKNDLKSVIMSSYGYSEEEFEQALNNSSVDFNYQAYLSSKHFLEEGTYSEESLKNLLVNSGYTSEEADAAINNQDLDFGEECVEYINTHYIGEDNPGSLENIILDLERYGFSESDINYAIEKTNLESYL